MKTLFFGYQFFSYNLDNYYFYHSFVQGIDFQTLTLRYFTVRTSFHRAGSGATLRVGSTVVVTTFAVVGGTLVALFVVADTVVDGTLVVLFVVADTVVDGTLVVLVVVADNVVDGTLVVLFVVAALSVVVCVGGSVSACVGRKVDVCVGGRVVVSVGGNVALCVGGGIVGVGMELVAFGRGVVGLGRGLVVSVRGNVVSIGGSTIVGVVVCLVESVVVNSTIGVKSGNGKNVAGLIGGMVLQ